MKNNDFRSAKGCFSTYGTVVTTTDNNCSLGVTGNSFSLVSLEPPLVLWSLSKESKKHAILTTAKNFLVNILFKNQENIAINFSKQNEPFSEVDYYLSDVCIPLINDVVAVFECELHAVYDGGDDSIILGLVTSWKKSNLAPLTFYRGKFGL